MKKSGLLVVLLGLCISSVIYAAGGVLPGSGTEGDPYLIEDLADFDAFADAANAETYWAAGVHTKLMCDINLSGRVYDRAVIAWDNDNTTSLLQGDKFAGVFDGNVHEISNLTIEGPWTSHFLALFGQLATTARVENLGVVNVDINVYGSILYVGSLCGMNDGVVNNCYCSGIVFGDLSNHGFCMSVGGLCGANSLLSNNSGTISNSSSSTNITLTNHPLSSIAYYDIGGLVGFGCSSIIECYSTGTIKSEGSVGWTGGLCGRSIGAIIKCYTNSKVICGENSYSIGGLCGNITDSVGGLNANTNIIEDCYSTGSLVIGESSENIGGLIGLIEDGIVRDCYTVSNISAGTSESGKINAFCGWVGDEGIVENSFWNVETSGIVSDAHFGAVGKTTDEMQNINTFVGNGWDFSDDDGDAAIWKMPYNDYPKLQWEEIKLSPDIDKSDLVDIYDVEELALQWLDTECGDPLWCNNTDLDKSGRVDIADYSIIAESWLVDYSSPGFHQVGCWKLDEVEGSTVFDSSGYGYDGIAHGDPGRGEGIDAGSYVFDGTNDYIKIGYAGIGGSGERTIGVWIKADEDLANSEKNFHAIMSWGKAEAGKKWVFMLDANSGQLGLSTYSGIVMGGPDLEDGSWHHVAVVLPAGAGNLNQVKMYVDGVEIATNAGSLDSVIDTALTEAVLIGAMDTDAATGVQSPAFFFKGEMDEVRIYNAAISEAEISEL